jgi:hypothetical protein
MTNTDCDAGAGSVSLQELAILFVPAVFDC